MPENIGAYSLDSQIDCDAPMSGKSTRVNSPKNEIIRRKLVLRSPAIDVSEFTHFKNLDAAFNFSSANKVEAQTTRNTKAVKKSANDDYEFSIQDSASFLTKPHQMKSGGETSGSDYEGKYKTELCRNYELTGRCKYGSKCSYAHGKDELVNKKHINLHYKSKKCNKFFEKGFCEYGARCQYLHKEDSFTHILDAYCEKLLVWLERNPKLDMSAIMKKTHAFGNRNSFFTSLEGTDCLQQETILKSKFKQLQERLKL